MRLHARIVPKAMARAFGCCWATTSVFRQRDFVAGLIFFCYNDYRTHVGDRGSGAMKQRVHGVVDVYGARKPSYAVLRAESSPLDTFSVSGNPAQLTVQLKTRTAAPAYALRGYLLRTVVYGFGDIPVERFETKLPDLEPGGQASAVSQAHRNAARAGEAGRAASRRFFRRDRGLEAVATSPPRSRRGGTKPW